MATPRSKLYWVWAAMIQRCTNPRNKSWAFYGGRGIKVCDRWRVYGNFLADMGERPPGRLTLDRINNNGDYEPGNVRYATYSENASNTRRNRKVCLFGEIMVSSRACTLLGLCRCDVIRWRLAKMGWPKEKIALIIPKIGRMGKQSFRIEEYEPT